MAEVIVFAAFLVAYKGLDILLSAYQMHLQAKIELNKAPIEENEGEEKHIGFIDYGDRRRKIEEEDYAEEE